MAKNDVQVDLGVLEPVLQDGDVTEIMVNGLRGVYVEKKGKLLKTDVQFESEEQLVQVIRNIFAMANIEIDPEINPIVDVRLDDGTRITAVFPPVSLIGPTVSISKYLQRGWNWDELIGFGSTTQKMVDFLRVCVKASRNIVVAGGTASGKTTIFNALAGLIPHDERIATVEAIMELQVNHPHLLKFEARPANREGKGAISVADLIRTATRMRIERILTSELSTDGGWAMLEAMNGGYDGSMFTIHATSPQDALERLETTIAMSGLALPLMQIRQHIASAISLIVQQMRLPDGKRRIVSITEITGIRNGVIDMHNIFEYNEATGQFRTTGYKPTFLKNLEYKGVALPDDFFNAEA
jgi:pilus assembly protein CpaF